MNVAGLIKNILSLDWVETNPPLSDITFRYDEFDPKSPAIQILIENLPAKSTWIVAGLYRIEHSIKITVYRKPISYKPSRIIEDKSILFNIKSEIDRILIRNRYSITSVVSVTLGTWDDKDSIAVGRGVKTIEEPILWRSEQMVTCIYYKNYSLVEE